MNFMVAQIFILKFTPSECMLYFGRLSYHVLKIMIDHVTQWWRVYKT